MRGTLHDIQQRTVEVRTPGAILHGDLALPDQPQGVILFAHGSGSSRFSSRNRAVAQYLNAGGFATLLLDLLSADEEALDQATGELRFDIPFLGQRLTLAADWLAHAPETAPYQSGFSVPAPARPPPSSRRQSARLQYAPLCPGAAAPTSPHQCWDECGLPRC